MSPKLLPLLPIANSEPSERFLGGGIDLFGLKLHGGLPLAESSGVVELVFGLLGLGTLLIILSSFRRVREWTVLSTLASMFGAGGVVIGALLTLFLLNPGGAFSSFLSMDATTFWRLFEVMGLIFGALVLWSFFSMLPWRWLGNLSFVAGAALLFYASLLIVVYTSPERLAPDPQAIEAQEMSEPEVGAALDRFALYWLNRPEAREQRLAEIEALPIEEQPTELVGLGREEALEALTLHDPHDPLVRGMQRGEARFVLFEAGSGAHAQAWQTHGAEVAMAELVRTHSLKDLREREWLTLGVLVLFFVLGLLLFFRSSKTNFFTALAFLLGGVAFFLALGLAIDRIHPGAWQHLLGLDRQAFELISEGNILWEAVPEVWVIALIIPLTLAYVATVYAWDRKTAGPGTKALLITLRLSVIALIIAMLFEPMLSIQQRQPQNSHVVVLLDTSQSMNQVELYANRWSEEDERSGEVRTHTFIRSHDSREQFGQWILDWLTLKDLEAQPEIAPRRDDPLRSGDAHLAPIARDLRAELARMEDRGAYRDELAQRLEARYQFLAADLLETIANERHAPVEPLRVMLEQVRRGELQRYHELLLDAQLPDGEPVEPILLTQGRLLYMLREARLPATDLLAQPTPGGERSWEELLAEGRPELHEALRQEEVGGTPLPAFGPMDNFVLELQVRRALRLYDRAHQLIALEERPEELEELVTVEPEEPSPLLGIGLAELRTLIGGMHEIEELIEPMQQEAAQEAFQETLAAASELRRQIERELRGLLPGASEARRDARSVLDHLHHSTEGGMRRLDIAIELMHPEAVHGTLLDSEDFDWISHLQSPPGSDPERANTVHLYTFDERLSRQALPTERHELARTLDRLEAPGIKTAIGISATQALRDLLQRHVREEHVAGFVILTDGQNNHGLPSTEQMRELEVNTVAIGSQDTLKHLELFQLQGPRVVNQGNRVSLTVRIRADSDYAYDYDGNPGGQTIDLRLYRVEEDEQGNERKISIPYEVMRDQTSYEFSGGEEFDGVRNQGGDYQSLQLAPAPSTQDLILEFDAEEGVHYRSEDIGEETRLRLWIMPEGQEPGDTFVDEETAENNWRDLPVVFTDRKTSVLYIEGRPRYEYRYLNAMMTRDPDLRYQGFLLSADPGWPQPRSQFVDEDEEEVPPLTRLPASETREEREHFFETYDVVILGDVRHDHERISSAFWEMLEEFVNEHAGSVVFIAGENYNPHGYAATDSPIRDLLPVHLYNLGADRPSPIRTVTKPYVLTPEGEMNEMLRLSPDREENRELWEERLHGFYWFNPYGDVVKEGATVLARHPREVAVRTTDGSTRYRMIETPAGEPYPMVVYMEYGQGASLYFNTDDLWFMRGGFGDRYYRPLWSQVVHYMAARKYESADEIAEVYTENRHQPSYNYPEPIRVEARLRGDNLISRLRTLGVLELREARSNLLRVAVKNEALPEAELETLELADEQGAGTFRGTYFPRATGRHTIWIQDLPDTVHAFEIVAPDDELQELPIDLNLLAEISHPRPDDTFAGPERPHAVLAPQIAQVAAYPLLVADDAFGIQEELSDAPILFLLIAFLLAIEWIIRKRSRLL